MEKGYVTFVKENKKDDMFLRSYTLKKDVKEGSEIACAHNMQISETLEESLKHLTKEDWDNLTFLFVEVIKEHNLGGMPLSKDVKVLEVISKNKVYEKLLSTISINSEQVFAKYMKGINLTIEQRAQILNVIMDKVSIGYNVLMAPLAYYQYEDKDAYNKLRDNVDPIIPIIKK